MMSTIRRRSSSVANSTLILPRLLPRSTFTRVSRRSERRSASSARPGATGRRRTSRRAGAAAPVAHGDDLLERPHADALGHHALGQAVLELGVLDAEQRAGVTGREHPGGDPALHGRGQLEQPQGVGDLRPGAPDPLGELLVGAAEVLQQLTVGGGLLQRVQLGPVQVLQQRVAEHHVVAGVPHDGRDASARPARGPPAALAHHQLVGALAPMGAPRPAAAARPRGSRRPARPSPPRRRPPAAAAGWVGCWSRGSSAKQAPATASSAGRSPDGEVTPVGRAPLPGAVRSSPGSSGARAGRDQRPEPAAQAAPDGTGLGAHAGPRRGRSAVPPGRRCALDRRSRGRPRDSSSAPGDAGIVGHHRLPVRRRLRHPDRARDRRPQHLVAEVLAHLVGDAGGETRARVVHRHEDRGHDEPRVEVLAHHLHGLEQLSEPLERVVLGLDRDEHLDAGAPAR